MLFKILPIKRCAASAGVVLPKKIIKPGRIVSPAKFLPKYLLNFHQNRLRCRPKTWARAQA
jgi:hypothetical protein